LKRWVSVIFSGKAIKMIHRDSAGSRCLFADDP
jgi:hypothetical protein